MRAELRLVTVCSSPRAAEQGDRPEIAKPSLSEREGLCDASASLPRTLFWQKSVACLNPEAMSAGRGCGLASAAGSGPRARGMTLDRRTTFCRLLRQKGPATFLPNSPLGIDDMMRFRRARRAAKGAQPRDRRRHGQPGLANQSNKHGTLLVLAACLTKLACVSTSSSRSGPRFSQVLVLVP